MALFVKSHLYSDCRGLDSDYSLVEAQSSGKLDIGIRASKEPEPKVARCQDATNAINSLNAINANGFRLIQKPNPADSAFAMTTEEINECCLNASEFENKLRKTLDMRACPKVRDRPSFCIVYMIHDTICASGPVRVKEMLGDEG